MMQVLQMSWCEPCCPEDTGVKPHVFALHQAGPDPAIGVPGSLVGRSAGSGFGLIRLCSPLAESPSPAAGGGTS